MSIPAAAGGMGGRGAAESQTMAATGQLGFHMSEVGAIRKCPRCQLNAQSLKQGLRPQGTIGWVGRPPFTTQDPSPWPSPR